ncbi:MAG: hypothetical protein KJ698_00470 [Actinobacteria bacterium]|nr:hypothetical protein [Actinomycetota bacterium]MBU1493924.1 hypothetical protein [Actinomycetota bacterium]MBU1866480.1 hypothetical protein [Actinomycetota bacterium]
MAWLWTDTLADLLETIDRVEPDALRSLRVRPVAYRLGDDGDLISLARAVYQEMGETATRPRLEDPGAGPGHSPSSRPA